MSYRFETERLILRPYGAEDWLPAHRILSDPHVIWWRKDNPMSTEETRAFHVKNAGPEGAAATGLGWRLAFEKAIGETSDGLMGRACPQPRRPKPEAIEVGCHILHDLFRIRRREWSALE